MNHTSIAILALALATPAWAQQPPLELSRALELGRTHSPLLEVADARLAITAGRAREAAAPANPTVEWRQENVGATGPADRFTTLTLPLDLTRQRAALSAAGREQVAAATADRSATRREIDVQIARRFHEAGFAGVLQSAAREEIAALEEVLRYEQLRLGEGVTAEGAVLRARLEVERARLALTRREAEAAAAHAALASAIGVSADQLAHAALPRATAPPALPPTIVAVEQALLERPEMLAAERRVEAARWGSRAALRATLPGVGVQVGVRETAGENAGILAFSVEVPIRDTGAAARERARSEAALAAAELATTRARIASELAGAHDHYQRLIDAKPAGSIALLDEGDRLLEIATLAYREGAITLVELLDAQRARADARIAVASWNAELALARIEYHRALGAPIEEGQ